MKTFIPKGRSGFTLIEILIVLVIIAILGSLAIPRFMGQPEKGRVAEAINILGAIRRGQEIYYNDHGGTYLSLPLVGGGQDSIANNWRQLGMEPPASNFWNFSTARTGTTTGTATATRKPLSRPTNCSSSATIVLSFPSGTDPWSASTSCYDSSGTFHPGQ